MFHFLTELRIVFGLQKQQPYGFEYNSLTPVGMPSILNPINTLCVIGKESARLSVCFWMLNGL